jgi:hypothetical protein
MIEKGAVECVGDVEKMEGSHEQQGEGQRQIWLFKQLHKWFASVA